MDTRGGGPVLVVEGLRVAYGERLVLDGVGVVVRAGEVVGVVGPNGCGKTTLLRAVTRVVPWLGGRIRIGEADVERLSPRELARLVAVVPQGAVLPLGYTAAEVTLMGRTPHLGFFDQEGPDDYRRAREALTRVDALDLFDRRVDELSGGERQNVILARAVVQDAPLLLLDEPTANLDLGHQIGVARLVRRLARQDGLAVLATLHDLTLASLYCDRLVLLAEGRVLADGRPAEVLTDARMRRAYGATGLRLEPPGLPGPAVLPWDADAAEG